MTFHQDRLNEALAKWCDATGVEHSTPDFWAAREAVCELPRESLRPSALEIAWRLWSAQPPLSTDTTVVNFVALVVAAISHGIVTGTAVEGEAAVLRTAIQGAVQTAGHAAFQCLELLALTDTYLTAAEAAERSVPQGKLDSVRAACLCAQPSYRWIPVAGIGVVIFRLGH